MNLENLPIRQAICESGLYVYQIAQKMGLSPGRLSQLICRPLRADDAERILQAIDDMKRGELKHGD